MLASCLRLLELCIKCVEDEACGIGDKTYVSLFLFSLIIPFSATAVSRSCQEAASFCCEYLTACAEQKIELDKEHQMAFYRFICMFASIGGAKIINKDFLKGAMPLLVNIHGK